MSDIEYTDFVINTREELALLLNFPHYMPKNEQEQDVFIKGLEIGFLLSGVKWKDRVNSCIFIGEVLARKRDYDKRMQNNEQ